MPKLQEMSGLEWDCIRKPVLPYFFHFPVSAVIWLVTARLFEIGTPLKPHVYMGLLCIMVLFVVCSLPSFIRSNIVGTPVYFWLDKGVLEIHDSDWWISRREQAVPRGPVLKIWFGGWFRKDEVIDTEKGCWTVRAHFNFLGGILRGLELRDESGCAVRVNNLLQPFSYRPHDLFWNRTRLADVLRVLATHNSVAEVLSASVIVKEPIAVAGKVG